MFSVHNAGGYLSRLPIVVAGVIVPLVLAGGALAQEHERTWIFSGTELVQALRGEAPSESTDSEVSRTISSARGNAYIAGVADLTSGTQWCRAGSVLPHELADRVFTYLGDLSQERLNESAATLVGEALAASFPCEAGQE